MGILDVPVNPARFSPAPAGMSFVAGAAPLTRRSTMSLGSPETTQAAAAIDYTQRTIARLPVSTTRWRLRVANRNVRLNTALTTPFSGTGLWIGTPVVAISGNYRWTGDFTGTPSQVLNAFTVPTDGSDYISPWITAAGSQLAAHTPLLLSMGLTATATGTGYGTSSGCQVAQVNSAGSAHAADVAITGVANFTAPRATALLDVRIEYEFVGTNKIGLFLGDSITAGTSDGDYLNLNPSSLPHESFPGVAGSMGRFCAINLGTASAKLDDAVAGRYIFTRVDLATCVPDFAVIALGTNNVGGTVATNMPLYISVINALAALGIQRIYVSTLLPRNDLAPLQGSLSSATTAGATSISSSVSIASGTAIQVGYGRKQDRVTTTGAPTGTGPFTIPVPALTFAHASGEQVISSTEMNRQQLNDWLRQLPNGVAACIDFDGAMANSPGSATPDLRLISNDGVHPLRGGYSRMGALVAALGAPV